MKCQGCKANLNMAGDLILKIRNGSLVIVCPICEFYTVVTVNRDGLVEDVYSIQEKKRKMKDD